MLKTCQVLLQYDRTDLDKLFWKLLLAFSVQFSIAKDGIVDVELSLNMKTHSSWELIPLTN